MWIKSVGLFLFCVMLLCSFSLCCGDVAFAKDLTLTWNHNEEDDLAGYRLYKTDDVRRGKGWYAIGKGNEVVEIPAGTNIITITVADQDWNFCLTAFNTGEAESKPSNEAVYTYIPITPDPPPREPVKAPTGLRLKGIQ